jgi:integrase/recombinase XerD
MDEAICTAAVSPLRQRLIDDMNMRRFSRATQHNHCLGRSPDTATVNDVRRFDDAMKVPGARTLTREQPALCVRHVRHPNQFAR